MSFWKNFCDVIYGSPILITYCIAVNIPAEILARGPEAVEAYVKLRKQGNAPLFRGRIFLLGQNRASNIRFRNALFPGMYTVCDLFTFLKDLSWVKAGFKSVPPQFYYEIAGLATAKK